MAHLDKLVWHAEDILRARHISFMSKAKKSYLRTHRKRCCLTQLEVAHLLGLESGQVVSKYERLGRCPSLETVLACQILFDVLPHDLYAGLYQKVEKLTMQRIQSLIEELEKDLSSRAKVYKYEVLVCAIERIRKRKHNV